MRTSQEKNAMKTEIQFDRATIKPLPIFIRELRDQIRRDRKTKTRRIIKPDPRIFAEEPKLKFGDGDSGRGWYCYDEQYKKNIFYSCPYGIENEVRYLREPLINKGGYIHYADDGAHVMIDGNLLPWRWKRNTLPQIHMPKNCARTFCVRTTTAVERVNMITNADAISEGVEKKDIHGDTVWRDYSIECDDPFEWFSEPASSFKSLWKKIHGEESLKENPWVWVIGFRRL